MITLAERRICLTCGTIIGDIVESQPDSWETVCNATKQHLYQNQNHRVGSSQVYHSGTPEES